MTTSRTSKPQAPRFTPLLRENYLMVIQKSVGSRIFQSFIVHDGKRKRDILENGQLSCAAFVSWVLRHFGLIAEPHATVDGTIRDLKQSGWRRIKKPVPGSVIVWKSKLYRDGSIHQHIGFYIGNRRAISNSTTTRAPARHHWTFGTVKGKPRRRVESIYFNNKLRKPLA